MITMMMMRKWALGQLEQACRISSPNIYLGQRTGFPLRGETDIRLAPSPWTNVEICKSFSTMDKCINVQILLHNEQMYKCANI